MNRTIVFAYRNLKEMLRDPLNLCFGIGFPIVLILLLSAIQANVPVPLFEIQTLSPGIAVFGLSFLSLFSGLLIAKDRTESFLMRMFNSPLKASEFILGYLTPLVPMALMQNLVCYLTAIVLGLKPTGDVFLSILSLLPTALLYIGIGMLCGSLLSDKQVGGVCGALLTNLSAWLSGAWFDLNLVGGAFQKIANLLPFSHAVNAARLTLAGDWSAATGDLLWVSGYALVALTAAIWAFSHKMRAD